jgi:ABC-type uncharacterized transport system fused permease/ATPase subunit
VIGRRLVGLNYYKERYQADFRFGLLHVRDNVEPIFIYGGEAHKTAQLRRRFDKVVLNFVFPVPLGPWIRSGSSALASALAGVWREAAEL